MKTTSSNLETDNLVLFPSAKNYALDSENLEDPMFDLLNEYADLSDSDIPAHLDDRFEEEQNDASYGSLEAFMNRKAEDNLTDDDKLVKLINERLEAINEAKARIKFYLDEIEMFLPRRR